MTNLKDIVEQFPKETGPSTAARGEDRGWVKPNAGSIVRNIWAGMSDLKNRTEGFTSNRCEVRRDLLPTETEMELLNIEQTGLSPSSAALLAANKSPHRKLGTLGNCDKDVTMKVSRPESHCAEVNT